MRMFRKNVRRRGSYDRMQALPSKAEGLIQRDEEIRHVWRPGADVTFICTAKSKVGGAGSGHW